MEPISINIRINGKNKSLSHQISFQESCSGTRPRSQKILSQPTLNESTLKSKLNLSVLRLETNSQLMNLKMALMRG